MKNMVGVIVVALVMVTGVSVSASETLKAIVHSYLDVQARLASDKFEGVTAGARAIEQQAAAMGAAGEPIRKSAKALESARDVTAAREAFGALSDAVIAAGNAQGWKDIPDVRVAYCPMVKKSWVQKEPELRNPYYGATMLTCGEFKKK